MKYKLVLTSMVMGAIVCSTSAVVGAANVAPQVSDTAKHDAVQSTWKDRTDIKLGMQFSRSSSFHEGLFPDGVNNNFVRTKTDNKNLSKVYVETLQPVTHYDEHTRSVVFVQGQIGHGGEKIKTEGVRGYIIPEFVTTSYGIRSMKLINSDTVGSETLGTTGSLGVGYRRLSENENAFVGVNAFVDRAFTTDGTRLSIGLEYVAGQNTFYANAYKGIGGDQNITFSAIPFPKRLYPNGYPSTYPDDTIREETAYNYTQDKALSGYDIGYVRTFKNARWVHAYINAFDWRSGVSEHRQAYYTGGQTVPKFGTAGHTHYRGVKLGTELQLTPHINVDAGYNMGSHTAKGAYITVKYTLGKSKYAYFGGKHSQDMVITPARAQMLDKVRRNDIVVEHLDDTEYDYMAPSQHL